MSEARRRIEERRAGLWARVRGYEPAVHRRLPVQVDEVAAALDALDEAESVEALREELAGSVPAGCVAASYEWYAAGRDSRDSYAYGVAATSCVVGGYSHTDLVKLGPALAIERDEPELRGVVEVDEIGIDRVMAVWYDGLAPRFAGFDYAPILNTPVHAPFNEAIDAFHELFRLALFSRLGRAFDALPAPPTYVFAKTRERWPVLVRDGEKS